MKPASNNTSPDLTNANDYYQQALTHLDCEEYLEAIVYLNQAIAINPNLAEAYKSRGFVYDNLGKSKKAIADYTKAIEINPQLTYGYNNRGIAYDKLGESEKAPRGLHQSDRN